MDENSRKTELDKLDIDQLIEETEEVVKEDIEKKEEESKKKQEKEQEEKPKKKLPLKLILRGFLLLIILVFTLLSVLEYMKKPSIKSGFYIINKKIVWLSKHKIEENKIKSLIKNYNFNLKIAYKFNSINGIKILSATLYTKFTSKTDVPLDKLYEVIKKDIYLKFKKLTFNKYLEDIPKYSNVISEIIQNTTLDILKKNIPDINMKEVKKNLNFTTFLIS